MNRILPPRPFFTAPYTSLFKPILMRNCAFFDALSFASILSKIFSARSGTPITTVGRSVFTSSPIM